MGLSRAAFNAGYNPASIPAMTLAAKAKSIAPKVIVGALSGGEM
jgi:hypothetical protein